MNKAFTACEILLPSTDDYTSFSVIACDQFTSDADYWKKLKSQVNGKLSALDLVLPENFLPTATEEDILRIGENIKKYSKTAKRLPKGLILTVRSTPYNQRRIGLIGALDLEEYDYHSGNTALIRATEGTIEDRLPPRLKVREMAEMEFPHVMVFIDDKRREVVEDVYKIKDSLEKLYDFDLNMEGGHLTGYFISDYQPVLDKMYRLLDEDRLSLKYGNSTPFLMAIGDGNHSLATAKKHWNKIKQNLSEEERLTHPARKALVEVVNIYDEGIEFKPIYRFVKGVNREKFMREFINIEHGKEALYYGVKITFDGQLSLPESIAKTDEFIKNYIELNGGEVDYIHGDDEIKALVDSFDDSVAILFNPLEKAELFRYVSNSGIFPKKTFSIGEAKEKRYYLEGRLIVPKGE